MTQEKARRYSITLELMTCLDCYGGR